MSVIVLHQAVEWLVQVGYNQISLNKEMLNKIKVKVASIRNGPLRPIFDYMQELIDNLNVSIIAMSICMTVLSQK